MGSRGWCAEVVRAGGARGWCMGVVHGGGTWVRGGGACGWCMRVAQKHGLCFIAFLNNYQNKSLEKLYLVRNGKEELMLIVDNNCIALMEFITLIQ